MHFIRYVYTQLGEINKRTNIFFLSNLVCMDIVKHFVLKENKLLYMYLTLVYYADILVNKGSKCTNNKTD